MSWFIQLIFVFCILSALYFLGSNLSANLQKQNIASGFEFLSLEASFDIAESLIEYSPEDSYLRALSVGALNTLKVSLIGNVLAIFIGIFFGISRLSSNVLVRGISKSYIEMFRNIPLLLQLFFWYALFTEIFPNVRNAYEVLPNIFLSNRGLVIPWILDGSVSLPVLQGFNFSGGITFSPEFLSLLLGLSLYTGAFIAEIVRSGILAINKSQWEASTSLGLSYFQSLRYVIFPQALRVIIPPLTSQILNLTKNSSLAVAIAYTDFVSIANTSLNQTGQAIELISLIMLFYLTLSITSSLIMNKINAKMALVEK